MEGIEQGLRYQVWQIMDKFKFTTTVRPEGQYSSISNQSSHPEGYGFFIVEFI